MNLHDSLIETLLSVAGEDSASNPNDLMAQFRVFMDQMPGGFFIYRADGLEELLYANQAMPQIFGCNSMDEFKELTGYTFPGIVHPDDLQIVEDSIAHQIEHSQFDLDYVEYRIVQKDGGIRWIEDYGHFVRSQTYGPLFYVFIADATDKKLALMAEKKALLDHGLELEQSLLQRMKLHQQDLETISEQRSRLLDLIAGLSIDYDSIFYIDLDNNLIYPYQISQRMPVHFEVNHAYPFTGKSGSYLQDWIFPDDRALLEPVQNPDYLRKRLAKESTFHINYRASRNGEIEYLQLRIINVGSRKHISHIVCGVRSVDYEIRHEMHQRQALEAALARERASSTAKSVFLSNVSHDICTPMNAIIGFTALTKLHLDDKEKVHHYLDSIQDSSEQLLHLLNDVLEYASLDSGELRLMERETNLPRLAEEILDAMTPEAEQRNIHFTVRLSGISHPDVICDHTNLVQILRRLIDNALKYNKPGGQATLIVGELPCPDPEFGIFRFTVEDNGNGIREEALKQIFQPFEREQNTTMSGVQGAGLGLTIVKGLTEMMGGTIDVFSAVDVGSNFTVTLNLRLHGERIPHAPVNPKNHSVKSYNILLVEDNEINREIATELLETYGFKITTAENGQIALDIIRNAAHGEFDLILMDLQMPVMDGYQATRAIRALDDPFLANLPIIAVSANALDADKKLSRECGMNAHLPKPININVLVSTIEQILEGSG